MPTKCQRKINLIQKYYIQPRFHSLKKITNRYSQLWKNKRIISCFNCLEEEKMTQWWNIANQEMSKGTMVNGVSCHIEYWNIVMSEHYEKVWTSILHPAKWFFRLKGHRHIQSAIAWKNSEYSIYKVSLINILK